jgi:F420-dependent oxidoreductase-like protein
VWSPHIFALDALIALSIAGREVPEIELGTAVVPTYPRHPMALAQLALTTAAAIGPNRLALGIGLSHQVVIEGMYGLSFDKPAIHMRDYLAVLAPLVREGKVSHSGKTLTGRGQLTVEGSSPFPILLAALAPKMLELAGAVADGTITWMTGPKTIETHINPTMQSAATAAGRPRPRTVAGLPICLTNDVAATRERAAKEFAIYGQLPSYRAMLDREGLAGPADLALAGDEAVLTAGLTSIASAGTDDLIANIFGTPEERARTRAFLRSRL